MYIYLKLQMRRYELMKINKKKVIKNSFINVSYKIFIKM